jgi:hypothetical protein
MSTTQSKALWLAERLDAVPETGADPDLIQESAAELRRLHDVLGKSQALCLIRAQEIERLKAELGDRTVKQSLPVDCPACDGGGLIPDPTWDWVRCELCHQRRNCAAIARATGEQA